MVLPQVAVPRHLIPDSYPEYKDLSDAEEYYIKLHSGHTKPNDAEYYRSTSVFGVLSELAEKTREIVETPNKGENLR